MSDTKYNIVVRGPLLSQSGYGVQARFALESLRRREDKFDIYLINTGWGNTSFVSEKTEMISWIHDRIKASSQYFQQGGQADISLQITIPNEVEKMAPTNVLYTAGIETTKVAPQWVEKSMLLDKIICVSNHAKQVFEQTSYEAQDSNTGKIIKDFRVSCPIDVVNYAVRDVDNSEELDLDHIDTEFNFLTVAQWGPRKNLDNTIKWFVEENIDNEDVGLIIKGSTTNNSLADRRNTAGRLRNLLKQYEDRKCKVYLLHGDLTEEEMNGLYNDDKVKAYVTTTHGEGFGLPMFEMAQAGKPIIAPGWSGQTDYLYMDGEPKFAEVDFDIKPVQEDAVWEGVIVKDSMWCYPKQGSFKMKMRNVYKNYQDYKEQAEELKEYLYEEFTPSNQHSKFVDSILDLVEYDSDFLEELEIYE